MKEYKYLYSKCLQDETIRNAFRKLRKGKTTRPEIRRIEENLDAEVAAMAEMIANTKPPGVPVDNPEKAFKPPERHPFRIHEHGKWRTICKPEIHEQWLHHIIALVLEPIVTATAYRYSCGSMPKRGAHFGKKTFEKWIRKNGGKNVRNILKADIRHFYDSIRRDVLLRELGIRIKDDWFLFLIETCLHGFSKGLPLGFYISQWLANYMLEPLDQLITGQGFRQYIRFMDDIVIAHPNKKKLHALRIQIEQLLGRRFRLRLKRNYQVFRFWYKGKRRIIGRALDFMGFKFYRDRTVLRKHILLAATRTAGWIDRTRRAGKHLYSRKLQAMVSYLGWLRHCDTYQIYKARIRPIIRARNIKRIISARQRRKNKNDCMVYGRKHSETRRVAGNCAGPLHATA